MRVSVNGEAYRHFWGYALERERVMAQRLLNRDEIVYRDPIVARYRFTNPYRYIDRTSQDLLQRIARWEFNETSRDDMVLRIVLYRIFNLPSTFDLLESVAPIRMNDFSEELDYYIQALNSFREDHPKDTIYSHAYTYRTYGKYSRMPRHVAHLTLVRDLIENGSLDRVAEETQSLRKEHDRISDCYGFGEFISMQIMTDIGYLTSSQWDENEFISTSIGSQRGIRKIFNDPSKNDYVRLLKWLHGRQEDEGFRPFAGRPLSLMDIQNCLCETDKYMRVAMPDLQIVTDGKTAGKRPEVLYRRTTEPLSQVIAPVRWGIDDSIQSFYERNSK